jgi:nucleotide-binding universal stress UspA family protein
VDGSPNSIRTVEWAAAFARKLGWSLHLVSSQPVHRFGAGNLDAGYELVDTGSIHETTKAILSRARDHVAGNDGLEITAAAATGDPAGVLVELSKDYGLVVIGSKGNRGFAHRLLGSVSSSLPSYSSCPVVVVPHHIEQTRIAVGGYGSKLPTIKRIVVGMDGSSSAIGALGEAMMQASAWDAEVITVAAVPATSVAGQINGLAGQIDHSAILDRAKADLDATVTQSVGRSPEKPVHKLVLDGNPADLLVEFSRAADLMVVGSRGRGGFKGLLLGSTSQAIIQHAACPVLIVPQRASNG